MNTVLKCPLFDAAAYLVWEENQTEKHEYIAGEVFAMAGAQRAHVVVAGNIFAALKQALRGSSCQTYISDMKLRVEQMDAFYYPDVMVTCDQRDQETPAYKKFPCLIVEVLSDSTEASDRGDKFFAYQELNSLREYVLINTKQQRVECFRRNEQGLWVMQFYTPQQTLFRLDSIDFEATLAALYEDVSFSETGDNS